MTLDEILVPIELHRSRFEEHLNDMLNSEVSLVKDLLKYINHNKGKRLRPNVMFLIAKALGEITKRTYDSAAMIELLHNATLVHDDVIDEANERRGLLSVNAKWNNKISILIGDYLFAHAMQPAFRNKDYQFLEMLSAVIRTMSEGELLAIQQSNSLEFDEEIYYKIIYSKTASLISICCKSGAATVTTDEKYIQAAERYGYYVGMAFQIKDDIFDYISNSATIGKPVGNDIKEHKITLPLIYTLTNSDKSIQEKILNMIKNSNISDDNIEFVINFAIENGGIEYATQKAMEFVEKAIATISIFEDSDAKKSLIEVANFVVIRDK